MQVVLRKVQTFDNAHGSNAFVVDSVSLASGTDDFAALLTLNLQLHMKNFLMQKQLI